MAERAAVGSLVYQVRRALKTLTPGERLFLHRRAHRRTQAEAAEEHGVSLDTYRGWEEDYGDVPVKPSVRLVEQSLWSLTRVFRRRYGIRLEEIGVALGRSTSWVHNALRGGVGAGEAVDYILRAARRRELFATGGDDGED